jgi:hypothetical protein
MVSFAVLDTFGFCALVISLQKWSIRVYESSHLGQFVFKRNEGFERRRVRHGTKSPYYES